MSKEDLDFRHGINLSYPLVWPVGIHRGVKPMGMPSSRLNGEVTRDAKTLAYGVLNITNWDKDTNNPGNNRMVIENYLEKIKILMTNYQTRRKYYNHYLSSKLGQR